MTRREPGIFEYGGEPQEDGETRACKKLIAAMIMRGLLDVRKPGPGKLGQRWRKDALRWFRSNRKEVWSFRWMCDVLEIDEGGVKRYLEDYY